jgi:hypothetical protein
MGPPLRQGGVLTVAGHSPCTRGMTAGSVSLTSSPHWGSFPQPNGSLSLASSPHWGSFPERNRSLSLLHLTEEVFPSRMAHSHSLLHLTEEVFPSRVAKCSQHHTLWNLLSILSTIATAVKEMCMNCGEFLDVIWILISGPFTSITWEKLLTFKFFNPSLNYYLVCTVIATTNAIINQVKARRFWSWNTVQ